MEHPENDSTYKGLQVNDGVVPLPSVNPYATFRRKKRLLTAEEYVAGIRRGDISILGQAVTLVESSLPSDQLVAQKVIEACLPYSEPQTQVRMLSVCMGEEGAFTSGECFPCFMFCNFFTPFLL